MQGRAPWPSFAADARAALAKRLKPLGLVFEPSPNGATQATFVGPDARVELVYDPWDVDLSVKVNGIWLGHLLQQILPGATEPSPSKQGLVALDALLADLLRRLSTPKGKRAANEASKWQSILTGDDPVAIRNMLEKAPKAPLRAAAAQRLAWMEPPTAVMAKSLARALGDPDPSVRLAAAEALYHRAERAPLVSTTALARALGDPNEDLRMQVLLALRQLGAQAKSAAPAVEERAKHGRARELRLATEVLAAMGRR